MSDGGGGAREIVVLHFPIDYLPLARRAGMSVLQWRSWCMQSLDNQGMLQLLDDGTSGPEFRIRNVEAHGVGATVLAHDPATHIDFFRSIFQPVLETMQVPDSPEEPLRLAVNLMPFGLPRSVADKLMWGLRAAICAVGELSNWPLEITLLTQLSDTFVLSEAYVDTLTDPQFGSLRFRLVDYRGNRCEGAVCHPGAIAREMFRDALLCDDSEFYKKLVFETNSFIGHFELPNSHARTHYDLNDLVTQQVAMEYLFDHVSALLAGYSSVRIVCSGLEVIALEKLSLHLERHIPTVLGHCDVDVSISGWADELRDAEAVLILTDIVHTGGTLRSAYDRVCEIRGSVDKVLCYAIASMHNSPTDLTLPYTCAAQIRRSYYPIGEPCLLCQLKQPLTQVRSLEDFATVHPLQLTPFDFWELVEDRNALRRREPEATGRTLTYRIATEEIVTRYSSWLRNVVRDKYSRHLETEIPVTRVLTVDEPAGAAFARVVSDALSLDHEALIAVDKTLLDLMQLPSVMPSESDSLRGERVLLVDDGINEGHTLRMLANYCQKHGGEIAGALVFDSRLSAQQNQSLRYAMGRTNIVSLYNWAATPIHCELVGA